MTSPDYAPLWSWIREREAIRVKKEDLRLPPPWTADPILAEYRFCNVRREDDRVTRWIAQHVREPFADHPLLWLMLCACRQINWPATIAELINFEGAWPSHANFTPERLGQALSARQARGEKIYRPRWPRITRWSRCAQFTRSWRETGVILDFSDVPNVLCETDKYLRVQLGQGRPRARYVPGRGA